MIIILKILSIFDRLKILRILSLIKNSNYKGLGIYYLLSSFIFGIIGTLLSIFIRIELYTSSNRIISPENLNFYIIITKSPPHIKI